MAVPTASYAFGKGPGGGRVGGSFAHAGVPGGNFRGAGPAVRFGGGGGYPGGYRGYRGPGFWPGAAAGAVIGSALAAQAYYGPGYGYDPDYYYDNGYYDDGGVVAVAPAPGGGDATAYCEQTYRSYDPRSGTYLGYDGYRHPCP